MRITVLAIGTRMPGWVTEAVGEYSQRLPREIQLDWRELPLAQRDKRSQPAQYREREGDAMLRALPAGDQVIALDVEGRQHSTEDLARQLRDWQMSGDNYSLLIGGPDGLSDTCLQRARQRWSLGKLTLPHPLVRVILAEQLYRAWTITVNHPYHRA
jgi:23S rRNA (pseudouridine1915-N3)-methyltransferase